MLACSRELVSAGAELRMQAGERRKSVKPRQRTGKLIHTSWGVRAASVLHFLERCQIPVQSAAGGVPRSSATRSRKRRVGPSSTMALRQLFEVGLRHVPILLAISSQAANKLIAQRALL